MIKTNNRSGMILSSFYAENKYLMLALREGHVELNCNLLNESEFGISLTSDIRVDDGNWHRIRIRRNETEVQLTTDDDWKGQKSDQESNLLNKDGMILRFGKNMNVPGFHADDYKTGFDGYIKNINTGMKLFSTKEIKNDSRVQQCS
ncbi:Uncharacterised protein g10522 [Pycnogonum litorale]